MAGTIVNNPVVQFFDNNGRPLSGGKITTYLSNTTTPASTWQNEGLSVLNTNPIILNSRGEATIWLTPDIQYTFVITDDKDNLIQTVNDIYGAFQAGSNVITAEQVTYNPAGLGAVATTVADKLQEFVSIEDFGASPTATPDENYTAIQAALDAHDAVLIPDNSYSVSDDEIIIGTNKKLYGLGKASQIVSASTTYAIRMIGQTSEVKNFFLGCAANGIYLDTASGNAVFNQIDDMYINGPGRGAASTTNSFVGVHFANQNGSLSCYFNWVTKNRVRGFNTLFLLDAPTGNSSLGANANQLIDNICEFYWVAYKIRGIENTIRGGFFNQAGGASSLDPTIGYLFENECSRNTVDCAQGEPGVNTIGYRVEAGCINNYIHMPSSNFSLGNIKQPNNSYNEEPFQTFSYSNLAENTYYTISLAGAIGTNNSYQHFQLEYSSSNAVINAQYHGKAEFILSRAGATVSANVIENKRLSIGSCVYFVGIFIDGSNIPNMVFLHRNNGSASTAGILNLRLRSIGRSLNFVLGNTAVSNGAVNPANYGGRFGSATYNPPSIGAGASVTTTVACPGATLGDTVQVAFGVDQQGLILSGYVSAVDTVTVVFFNPTGAPVDLASSLLRVRTEPLPFL